MAIEVAEAYVGKSGQTVVVVFRDSSTLADVVLSAGAGDATISINGGGAITLAVKKVTESVVFMPSLATQSFTVVAGDTVTITAPSGWVTASAGSSPTITAQTLTNRTGVEHLTTQATNGGMILGWNLHKPSYFNPVPIYNNFARQANRFTNASSTYDSNGYPTALSGATEAIVVQCNSPSSEGWDGFPDGTWRIYWDGASGDCTLAAQGANSTVVATTSSTGAATDNFREYTVTTSTLPGGIKYAVTAVPVSNIRIYPPGVDTTQKFRDEFLDQIGSPRVLRFLDAFDTNSSNVIAFSDFTTSSAITYFRRQNQQVSTPASFSNWTNDGSFEDADRVYVLCTTTAAHGFSDGMTVDFSGTNAIACNSGAFTISAGTNRMIKVVSSTTFSFAVFRSGGGTVDGTQSQPGAAEVLIDIAGTMPLADAVELCNLKQTDMWFCVPHLATDACVTSAADYIAANLDDHLRCICEYSNELWNTGTAFNQFRYAYMQGQFDAAIVAATANKYTRGDYWSAQRATQVHTLFSTSWSTAGRASTNLVRFLGSQVGSTAQTTNRLFWAVDTLGKTIDAVGVAVYWDNNVVLADAATFTDECSTAQMLDLAAAVVEHDTTQETTRWPAQKAIIDSYSLPMWCYETGPEVFSAGSTTGMEESRAVARDPRMRYFMLNKFKQMELAGFRVACCYVHGGANGSTSGIGGSGNTNWQHFVGHDQVVGLGDGSDGLFDNRTAYDNHAAVVSVQGYAVHEWMGMFSASVRAGRYVRRLDSQVGYERRAKTTNANSG